MNVLRWWCLRHRARHREHQAWAAWYENPGPATYEVWKQACKFTDRVDVGRP